MKAFTISAVALLTSMVAAAPTPNQITITFLGAADGRFTQDFPIDSPFIPSINSPLSVSKISNPGGANCFFYGVDGSQTTVPSGQTVDVGPPQELRYGYCYSQ